VAPSLSWCHFNFPASKVPVSDSWPLTKGEEYRSEAGSGRQGVWCACVVCMCVCVYNVCLSARAGMGPCVSAYVRECVYVMGEYASVAVCSHQGLNVCCHSVFLCVCLRMHVCE
jgi:hypothetical protein